MPLIVKEQVIGVQTPQHSTRGYYTTRHAELATMFAQQAAVALENARLYEQVRGTAALEERQRLARELHDSVSQALYGILLNASTADELFDAAPAQAIQARHGLQVRMQVAGEPDLPHPAKEALYRVAQEAMHNALKHAFAQSLDLAGVGG